MILDCQVEGEGPISITWRRNGVPVETGIRAAVLSNGTLLIRNFSKRQENNKTDAGEYDCAAQNRYGLLISRKARVLLACESHDRLWNRCTNMQQQLIICINVPPAALPKFLSHPESMAVGEGGVARLTCQINGIPEAKITWQKDRQPLSTKDPRWA